MISTLIILQKNHNFEPPTLVSPQVPDWIDTAMDDLLASRTQHISSPLLLLVT